MTQPNQAPRYEMVNCHEFFHLINDIEPSRSPEFTAFEQIKGPELAKMFLQGYATWLSATQGRPLEDPFGAAVHHVRYAARYYTTDNPTSETGSQQLEELLRPWEEAYTQLAGMAEETQPDNSS